MVDVDTGGVKAPDGGWGWAVLAGCFVITGFSYAFPKAVSVFFKELIREFGVGYSDTAWISSILLAMLYGTGRLLLVQYNTHIEQVEFCNPEINSSLLISPFVETSPKYAPIHTRLHYTLSRSPVQCAGKPLWLSSSHDGGRPLHLSGDDPGLFLHWNHPHLPLHWGYHRSDCVLKASHPPLTCSNF